MKSLNSRLAIASLWFLVCSSVSLATERLEVDLRNAARDPMIDFTSPIAGSPDRVEVTRDGLFIRQGRDKKGVAKRDTGFKFLLSASGDFTASLDLKKVRLEEPSSGWGQGLVFSVWLDDPEQSVLQICLLAMPGSGVSMRAEKIGRNVKMPIRKNAYIDFESGRFVISRVGTLATFSVVNGSTETEILKAECGSKDIQSVSVWCTRQDQGNTPAEYLLRSLTVQADGFYSYQKANRSFTWWQVTSLACLAALVVAISLKVRAARNPST
jgi:hypothetical protein